MRLLAGDCMRNTEMQAGETGRRRAMQATANMVPSLTASLEPPPMR